jgi:hypothetical protein
MPHEKEKERLKNKPSTKQNSKLFRTFIYIKKLILLIFIVLSVLSIYHKENFILLVLSTFFELSGKYSIFITFTDFISQFFAYCLGDSNYDVLVESLKEIFKYYKYFLKYIATALVISRNFFESVELLCEAEIEDAIKFIKASYHGCFVVVLNELSYIFKYFLRDCVINIFLSVLSKDLINFSKHIHFLVESFAHIFQIILFAAKPIILAVFNIVLFPQLYLLLWVSRIFAYYITCIIAVLI